MRIAAALILIFMMAIPIPMSHDPAVEGAGLILPRRVQGVVRGLDGEPTAMVDGMLVREGDSVDDAGRVRVLRIETASVTFRLTPPAGARAEISLPVR